MKKAVIILAILLVFSFLGNAWLIYDRTHSSAPITNSPPATNHMGASGPTNTPPPTDIASLQAELAALQLQLADLNAQAQAITDQTPDAAQMIKLQMLMTQINQLWTQISSVMSAINQYYMTIATQVNIH